MPGIGLPKEIMEAAYLTASLFVLGWVLSLLGGSAAFLSAIQVPAVTLGTFLAMIGAVYVKDFLKKQIKL